MEQSVFGRGRADLWTAKFSGVIVATVTPMKASGALDLDAIEPYVEFLLERGADALMVLGTTGEFIALTPEEREQAQRRFLAAVGGRVPVIVQVGHVDVRIAAGIAADAVRAGADAIASITPYYHHFTASAVEEHQRSLATSFPETPFFVYNYPEAAGKEITFDSFRRLLDHPHVCGVKLSVATWAEVEPFLESPADVLVTCGTDQFMERFMNAGGRAIVSGNAAAFPEALTLSMAAFRSQDPTAVSLARRVGDELVALTLGGAPDRVKEVLAARKVAVGGSRIRTFMESEVAGPEEQVDRMEALVRELRGVIEAGAGLSAGGMHA